MLNLNESWLIWKHRDKYNVELAAAIMNRHIAPFTEVFVVGKKLIHEFAQSKSTLFENAGLSILSKNDIFRSQRCG